VDPSEQQIRVYPPAADGSGFPAKSFWLATTRDVSKMSSTYVNGDLYAVDGGNLLRFAAGKNDGWDAKAPPDSLLRPAPNYVLVSGEVPFINDQKRSGNIYAFDKASSRLIAVAKADGKYQAQYRLAGGSKDWSDMRAMYIIAGAEGEPATLVWMSPDGVNQAILLTVPDAAPQASPGASASPSGSPARTSPKPSKKP
jgi:hypothetical protein